MDLFPGSSHSPEEGLGKSRGVGTRCTPGLFRSINKGKWAAITRSSKPQDIRKKPQGVEVNNTRVWNICRTGSIGVGGGVQTRGYSFSEQ